MTEKRALEKSIEMWEKLKELREEKLKDLIEGNSTGNIVKLKHLYFENIVAINPKYNIPTASCYLCEYAARKDLITCRHCPVKNWSINRKYGEICKGCMRTNSVLRTGSSKDIIDNVLEVLKETYNDLYNN